MVQPSELNKHDRVRVKWNSAEQSDDGTVTDTTVKLEGKTSVSGAFVAYDDGCRNWHFNGDNVTIWRRRLSAVTAPPPPQAGAQPRPRPRCAPSAASPSASVKCGCSFAS